MSVINQIQVGSTTYDIQDAAAVPSSRKINNKALSSDITLAASDVGAVPSNKLPSVITTTLSAANWSSNEQTVSDAGLSTSGFAYIVAPSPSSFSTYAGSVIYADDVTVSGQMTFHCEEEPTNDIDVNILKVGI